MVKRDKRLKKARQNPKGMTFEMLHQILIDQGFELRSTSGSHHNYRVKIGEIERILTVPSHGKTIKPAYVRQALDLIDELLALAVDDEEQTDAENEDE